MTNLKSKSKQLSQHTLRKNLIANFAGTIVQALMGIIFIPLYIMYLGIEAWGLIGIFTTLQVIFSLLDMGLSSTLNREMARLSVLPHKEQEMRNLVRTLEAIYWGIAIFVGIIVATLSPFIAHYWINPGKLSTKTVEQALLIMGFVMALQMPIGLYSGGLMGLQKQVLLNIINTSIGVLRGAGVILILWLVSPTIQAFFLWQIVTSAINIFLLAFFLWRRLPFSENRAVFQKQLLKGIWKFAAGMSGISIFAVILTQLDKVILSKMLSLEMFGYYMLASVVAMSLGRLFTPVFYSIYPKLTQLAAIHDENGVKQFYHKSCQFMAVLIMPIALVVAFFSYDIIFLWTQNALTAEKTHLLISILICGTAINGLMNPPYALQLAYGWTKLNFLTNLIAVIVMIPLIYYLTRQYGATGAAISWLMLNIGYFIFTAPLMHRRLLSGEKWRWYWNDVGIPLLVGLSVVSIGQIFLNNSSSQLVIVLVIAILSTVTLVATLLSLPKIRSVVIKMLLTNKFVQLLKIKLVPENK